jgi:hypothetical protein
LLFSLFSATVIHHNYDVVKRGGSMKTRKNIYFTDPQVKRLEKKAQEEGLSEAEIVRRALDAYLAWDDPDYRPAAPTPTRNGLVSPG